MKLKISELFYSVQGEGRYMGVPSVFLRTFGFPVSQGDYVLIPDGAFHKVINSGDMNLIFNCIFDGKRSH